MKVTKYVHSCLLVETAKQVILLDPGNYTYDSHLLHPAELQRLDFVVITHGHPDHYNPELLKEICAKFPQAVIITNEELTQQIKDEGIKNSVTGASQDGIEVFPVEHEPLPMNLSRPQHIGVHIEERLTCPGDALKLKGSREVLALPITAPWGSFREALAAATKLKPKKIIPVHDWHWHQQARLSQYAFAKELLAPKGIEFIEIENGQPAEV